MKKVIFGLIGMSLFLMIAFGVWSCSKPASPTPIYSITLDLTNNTCDSVFTLDGGQPTTITTASYSATLYNNVSPGNHVIGVTAGTNSVSCTDDIEFTHYVIQINSLCPPATLTCGSIIPE